MNVQTIHGPWSPQMVQNSRTLNAELDVLILSASPPALVAAYELAQGGAAVGVIAIQSPGTHAACQGLGVASYPLEDAPAILLQSLGDPARALLKHWSNFVPQLKGLLTRAEALEGEGVYHLGTREREKEEWISSLSSLEELRCEVQAFPNEVQGRNLGLPGNGSWPGGCLLGNSLRFDPSKAYAYLWNQAINAGAQIVHPAGPWSLSLQSRCLDLGFQKSTYELMIVAGGMECTGDVPILKPLINRAYVQGLCVLQASDGRPKNKPWAFVANGGFEAARQVEAGPLLLSGFRYMDAELAMGPGGPFYERVQARQLVYLRQQLGVNAPKIQRFSRAIDIACDSLPLVGPAPGDSRLHLLTGLSGSDFTMGVGLGQTLARQLLGDDVSVPHLLSPRRML